MGSRPLFQLNPRLSVAAGAVPSGAVVADVGTDHAYLPIWLVKKGICPNAIAMDIRQGPLDRARENIRRYQVENKISLRLSDGLERLCPGEAAVIVIAGMGGELIGRILARAPWLKEKPARLVLQPMSAAAELRVWLSEEGFAIEKETAVLDAGRIYTVMEAVFNGERRRLPARYPYIGGLEYTQLAAAYARRELRHLQNQAHGAQALKQPERLAWLQTAVADLEQWLAQGGAV